MSNYVENFFALRDFANGMSNDGFDYYDLCIIILNEIPADRIKEIIQNKGNNRPLGARSQ